MNHAQVMALKCIAVALIETEAMKAANREREREGMAQAYPESAFFRVANDMESRVNELASFM